MILQRTATANAEVFYEADTLYWLRVFWQRTQEILAMLQAGEVSR